MNEPWYASRTEGRIVRGSSRDHIFDVAARWAEQYRLTTNAHHQDIARQLAALDARTASVADVERIIGNTSWTRQICDICNRYAEEWTRLGDVPDYDSATVHICDDCLAFAARATIQPESE